MFSAFILLFFFFRPSQTTGPFGLVFSILIGSLFQYFKPEIFPLNMSELVPRLFGMQNRFFTTASHAQVGKKCDLNQCSCLPKAIKHHLSPLLSQLSSGCTFPVRWTNERYQTGNSWFILPYDWWWLLSLNGAVYLCFSKRWQLSQCP